MNKLLLATLLTSAMISVYPVNSFARTTRDLVFEDEPVAEQTTSTKQVIAMKTTVVLTRADQTMTVLPNYEFKSGDKVKLVFTPNIDGYVYWMTKGTSGKHTILFPSSKTGTDNKVTRNTEYTVPVKGFFRFDAQAGDEHLLCILSSEPLKALDDAIANNSFETDKEINAIESQNKEKRTTRDLVFEEEDKEDVNTKKQESQKGTPFVDQYILKHN